MHTSRFYKSTISGIPFVIELSGPNLEDFLPASRVQDLVDKLFERQVMIDGALLAIDPPEGDVKTLRGPESDGEQTARLVKSGK